MRVGVLGLGRMGLPIAVRLAAASFEVLGFDTAVDRRSIAGRAEVGLASSGHALARWADVLVTVLPGPIEVERALVDGMLLHSLSAGALWLDLSSDAPDVVERLAEMAGARGVSVVSAPMAGGPSAVASARLRFFVGAEPAAVERATPLLVALGGADSIDHVGTGVGDGCTAKLLANLLWFGQVVAVTEALLLGASLGVPPAVLRRTLAHSAGGSVFIDDFLDSLLAGDYLETFGIDRCVEELDTLVRLAARADVPFELSTTVMRLHREALERFGAIDGELLAAKLLELRAGTELRGQEPTESSNRGMA